MKLQYYVNLDERGEFYADVRNANGETIYEIIGFDIFEDGFMRHKDDMEGLLKYLKWLGIAYKRDTIGKGE